LFASQRKPSSTSYGNQNAELGGSWPWILAICTGIKGKINDPEEDRYAMRKPHD
jgi:hypothetical protein